MANLLDNLMELAEKKSAVISISGVTINAQRGQDFICTPCRWEDGTPATLEENIKSVAKFLSRYEDGPIATGKCGGCGGEAVLWTCDENKYCFSCGKAYYNVKQGDYLDEMNIN